MKKTVYGTITAILLALTLASVTNAQISYSDSLYTSMAEAGSSATIRPGTRITLQNWQQYKHFMPASMQAGFSQQYGWKIGSDPKFTMVVGPTASEPMFHQLRENTEKYAGQAQLQKVATGGYTLKGYVAGVPFPNPPVICRLIRFFIMFGLIIFPLLLISMTPLAP
jgi:hypothetical protein